MSEMVKYSLKEGYNEMDFDGITRMLREAQWR